MRQGASVVWHVALPLQKSFNNTEAAIFPCSYASKGLSLFLTLIRDKNRTYRFFKA